MMASFEETVLSISGKPFPEAFRLYQSQRPPPSMPSAYYIDCPYSEMKHFVETVFKQWIKQKIADADNQDDAVQPVILQADKVDPLVRFYLEADACRDVFETWVNEACGMFNIAKPPPAAALPTSQG